MLNNFIYSETKGLFLEQLDQKNIPEEAIAFLEDSGEIGNRNHYFGTVGVNNLLTEGKLIGTITANNNPYNIYAPKTYNWSEITNKPTTLAGYGITDAVSQANGIEITNGKPYKVVGYGYSEHGWKSSGPAMSIGISDGYLMQIQSANLDGSLYHRHVAANWQGNWYKILDESNYASVLDTRYIQLTGGTIEGGFGSFNIMRDGEKPSSIRFVNTSTALGAIGFNASSIPCIWDGSGTNERQLLHAGNYESIVGDKFLKLTGGMINTGDIAGLTIYRNNSKYSMIHFCNNEGNGLVDVGYLGVVGEGVPAYLNSGGSQFNLLHAGNFNTYAPTLAGTGASGTWGIHISKSARYLSQDYLEDLEGTDDLKTSPITGKGLFVGVTGASAFGDVDAYGTSLFIGYGDYSRVGRFIFRRSDNSGVLYWQTANAGATAWGAKRLIAFTDSDITGNAASATKLATPRSLWGNPFDGTVDVNTRLTFNANDAALAAWTKDGSSVSLFLQVNPDRHVLIGQGTARENGGLYLYGNDIRMCYGNAGSSNNTAMLINSSGNVTIGSSDLASTDFKFMVNGDILATSHIRTSELRIGFNQADLDWVRKQLYYTKIGFAVEGEASGYQNLAMTFSTMYNSSAEGSEVERMRISSNGNVGIGTASPQAKLHVNGVTTIGTSAPNNALMLDVRGKMRISPNYFNDGYSEFDDRGSRLFYVSESYGWANGTYAYKTDGTSLASFHMVGSANSFTQFTFRIGGTECLAINSSGTTISGDLKVTGNIIADGQVSSGGIEIDPATISTQISQLTATIEGLQSTVKLLQDELNSLK